MGEPDPTKPSQQEEYTFEVDGTSVTMLFWDTVHGDCYERYRPQLYPGTDVFMILFDPRFRDSFDRVFDTWYPEIKPFCKKVPFFVVSCESPKRNMEASYLAQQPDYNPVSDTEGQKAAKKIGAFDYIHCPAMTPEEVSKVFYEVVHAVLETKNSNSSHSVLSKGTVFSRLLHPKK